MGTVHARSLEPLPTSGPDFGGEEAELVEVEPETKQEILENKDVVVQHIHFEGLGRTKDDIIMYEIGDNALPNGLDVTFDVTELRRLTGSYNTMVGNNEGSMVLGLKLPNILGRAEKVTFQFSYGTKETSYGLSVFKPQPGHFERNISLNVYKITGQFPWSSLRETDRGISTEVNHAMVIDSRNSSILPKRGALLKINQELAGYTGGDVSFLKEDFELQLNKRLLWDSVLSASLWGGMLVPIGDKPSSIADRFYLGGPTSVRGFSMYSIGPQSEGDYLGGEAYWAGGLHLYTPLPFRPGQGEYVMEFSLEQE
ncbi:putative Sorting and assembly machinery component 50 protein [Naja naja]|nr:putative Sorting and assembly machinery component 50 protein [Naja naja]